LAGHFTEGLACAQLTTTANSGAGVPAWPCGTFAQFIIQEFFCIPRFLVKEFFALYSANVS